MRIIITYILLFILCYYVNAENSSDFRFSVENINSSNGLSSDLVNDILQDKDGFLWFATEDGLNRYDGYTLKIFKPDNSKGTTLNTNHFKTICEASNGKLWLGTNGKGINILNKYTGEVEIINTDSTSRLKLLNNNINKLFSDNDGNIWIGYTTGIQQYNSTSGVLTTFTNSANKRPLEVHIFDIFQDSKSKIWIGTLGSGVGLYNYKNDSWKFYSVTTTRPNGSKNWCRSIFEDKEGNMWFGTWGNGFYKANTIKNNKIEFTYYNQEGTKDFYVDGLIYAGFSHDSDGNIWAGGPEGLDLLVKTEKGYRINTAPTPINGDESFALNTITKIIKDNSGILWISTLGNGIFKINPNDIKFVTNTFNPKDLIVNNNAVYDVEHFKENTLLIGLKSNGFGLYSTENNRFTSYLKHNEFNELRRDLNTVRTITRDKKNRFWFGTRYNGVFTFDANSGEIIDLSHGSTNILPIRSVNEIIIDSKNNYWIVSRIGVYKLTETNKNKFNRTYYSLENGLPSILIETVYEDKNGTIWFGSEDAGLIKMIIDKNDQNKTTFKNYLFSKGNNRSLSSNKVISIFEDSDSNFWVGTEGGGLNKFDREKEIFTRFSRQEGMLGDAIYSITEDKNGFIWMSSNNGLYRYKPDKSSQIQFENFTVKDGLQGNIFIKGSFFKTNENILIYGGHNGFNIFDPLKIKQDTFIPPIKISDFKILNSSVDFDFNSNKEIEISHKQRSFSFEFTALSFSHPEKNSYAYMLEGYDDEWQFTDASSRKAYYSNLPQGTYTFKVKGANSSGIWNEVPTAVKLKVHPSPFLSGVAYFIYFIILLSLIFLIYRFLLYRTSLLHTIELEKVERTRIEKLNQFKLRFFTNISHELLTPLSIISCGIEEIENVKTKEEIDTKGMLNNVNRLVKLIRQLLDFRKIEAGNMKLTVSNGNLSTFVDVAAKHFAPLVKRNNIDYSITLDEKLNEAYFDGDKIDKVIHNILSNAFKYTPSQGKISISCKRKTIDDSNYAVISISDNGKGISAEKIDNIFERFYRVEENSNIGSGIGLSLSKNMIELHNGEINVHSKLNEGTEFLISIPIDKNAYLESQVVDSSPNHSYSNYSELEISSDTTHETTSEPTKSKTILLVEDNHEFRASMARALRHSFNIIEASNGVEGFEKARTQVPDVVVSDVMMPEMNGFELCQKLKMTLEISHIPIILLTAKTGNESRNEGYEVGADSYLDKPVNVRLLKTRIKSLLDQREKLKHSFQVKIDLEPEKINLPSLDEKFIKKAKAIIETNIDNETFNVHRLVKEMGTSNSMLYRKLSSLTGLSPNEFIKNIRLKRAAQLLSDNKFNISEVAYATGFHDQSYFSVCFKKHFGMTPTEFINKNENKK